MNLSLHPEEELLVQCARLHMTEERREAVSVLLAESLDWEVVVDKAVRHRLATLLFRHLSHNALSHRVPPSTLQRLQRMYSYAVDMNLSLEVELHRVLYSFQANGISTIVLKGAAFARAVYGDIGLRPMGDIDVLVQPKHLDQAEVVAKQLGYRILASAEADKQTRQNHRHLPNLWHPAKRVVLEIHRHIISPGDPGHFALDGFWMRAKPAAGFEAHALALAPEDLLVHLCMNFFLDRRYHSLRALGQLCDIAEVVCHYNQSLDWSLVEQTASEHEIGQLLYCSLYAARELLESPASAEFMAILRPAGFDEELADLFIRRRVVDTRPWLAHGLVPTGSNYGFARATWGILRRFFPGSVGLSQKYHVPATSRRIYFLSLKWPSQALLKGVRSVRTVKEDLILDRWLHSLSSPSSLR